MAEVKKLVLIEKTPKQMFDLVDDVESYPKFPALVWWWRCDGTNRVRYEGNASHQLSRYQGAILDGKRERAAPADENAPD